MKRLSTFRASRSLSRLCPMRMDSALNMLSSTAWTSLRVMVVLSKSSSVTPENLWATYETHVLPLHHCECFKDYDSSAAIIKRQWNDQVIFATSNWPCVVVDHFALRFDKGVIDDFHLWVNDRHPRQLQALPRVTLFPASRKKKTHTQ